MTPIPGTSSQPTLPSIRTATLLGVFFCLGTGLVSFMAWQLWIQPLHALTTSLQEERDAVLVLLQDTAAENQDLDEKTTVLTAEIGRLNFEIERLKPELLGKLNTNATLGNIELDWKWIRGLLPLLLPPPRTNSTSCFHRKLNWDSIAPCSLRHFSDGRSAGRSDA